MAHTYEVFVLRWNNSRKCEKSYFLSKSYTKESAQEQKLPMANVTLVPTWL